MNISIDISMYPLKESFEQPIVEFIKALRASGLTVEENGLSTQLFGPYDQVMDLLKDRMHETLLDQEHCVFTLKVVSGDRSNHAAAY